MTRVITQRELRNESAAVMDAVEAGETIVVTRNGNPVAELRPVRRRRFAAIADVAHALHGLPPVNLDAMRAETDRLFGSDTIDD
jgi:prevent-host-death family protein